MLVFTVMAQIVSVEMDSVRVFRIGETPARNRTKSNDGSSWSLTRSGGGRELGLAKQRPCHKNSHERLESFVRGVVKA